MNTPLEAIRKDYIEVQAMIAEWSNRNNRNRVRDVLRMRITRMLVLMNEHAESFTYEEILDALQSTLWLHEDAEEAFAPFTENLTERLANEPDPEPRPRKRSKFSAYKLVDKDGNEVMLPSEHSDIRGEASIVTGFYPNLHNPASEGRGWAKSMPPK